MKEQYDMLRARLDASGDDKLAWCGEHGDIDPDLCVESTGGAWLHFVDAGRTRLCTNPALIILERNPDAAPPSDEGAAEREPLALVCVECEIAYTADGDPAALARLAFPLVCWACSGAVMPR